MRQLLKMMCLASLIGFSGHVFADEDINATEENLVSMAYPVGYQCMPCTYVECGPMCGPVCGPMCGPVCGPCQRWNFNLSADYLYWQVRSEELPYVADFVDTGGGLGVSTIKHVNVDTASGVRLGLGSIIPCFDCWEISADWTHLHSKSKDRTRGAALLAIWLNPSTLVPPTLAEAQYDFTINIADLSVEKGLCIGRRWMLSPSLGLRGVWIDQDLHVDYTNTTGVIRSKNSIDFRGGGIRTGLSSKLRLCGGLSLVGWSYIDLLWSHVKIRQLATEPTGVTRNGINDDLHTMTPVFELFLGLSWEQCVCRTRWEARLGWEEQYFVNGVQFNQFTGGINNVTNNVSMHQLGGLSLGGLTAGLKVSF